MPPRLRRALVRGKRASFWHHIDDCLILLHPDLTRLHAARMANDATGYEMEEMRPRFQSLADRHTNGTAPRAVSIPTKGCTPTTNCCSA